MKLCQSCKIEKSLSEFQIDRQRRDGLRSYCKSCRAMRAKERRESRTPEQKEYQKARDHAYYEATKLERLAVGKKWRSKNLEVIAVKAKVYREANAEYIKNYREEHKERFAAQRKEYYQENKESIKETYSEYYAKNREKVLAQKREYNSSPAKYTTYAHQLPIIDKPTLSDDGETLLVICKHCQKIFTPSQNQVSNRIKMLSTLSFGENNFYCSDICKLECPVFRAKADPHNLAPGTRLRSCQTDHLKQLQCDEHGYNYCEHCGDIIDVELHHTQQIKDGVNTVTSAGHILLCAGCHTELHAACT